MDADHPADENATPEDDALTTDKPKRKIGRPRPITVVDASTGKPVKRVGTGSQKRKNAPPKNVSTKKGYKYDWPNIRRLFVEGILPEGHDPTSESREFPSLKELSERVNVPYDSIRAKSSDERWFDQRQDYVLRMSKARQAKRIQEMAKESFDFDQSTLKVAKLGMGMVTARMSEIAREVQEQQRRREEALRLASAGYDIDMKDLQTVIDARELNTLSQAAVSWQLLGQKAMGTDITRLEVQHDIQHNIDVDVEVTTIAAELGRDDPDRLAAFLQAAKRAGLLDVVMQQDQPAAIEAGDPDIVDAEVIEEGA